MINSQIYGISPLNISIIYNNIEKMEMIINHPSFDKLKSDINEAIFTAAIKNNINAFTKLIKLIDNDVNITSKNGENLLFIAAKNLSGEIIDEIFNTPQFDSKNNQICESITNLLSLSNNYKIKTFDEIVRYFHQNWHIIDNQKTIPVKSNTVNIIEKIYKYDQEHEKSIDFNIFLPNGKTLLTNFSDISYNTEELIQFLLNHGADPNMKDKNGDYPLQIAIESNSFEFVSA